MTSRNSDRETSSSQVIFKFPDGREMKWDYVKNFRLKGIRSNGQRPNEVWVDQKVLATSEPVTAAILYALSPSYKIHSIYTPIEQYVIKDQKLVPLVKDISNDDRYLDLPHSVKYLYQEELDGIPLGKEEAMELFPEEFI